MKLYLLVNSYCTGKQAYIQAMHAGFDLLMKYHDDSTYGTKCVDMITDWYNNHKTVVVLNAGNSDMLHYYETILDAQQTVPYDVFCEPGLDGAMTAIAILASTEMVEDMKHMRDGLYDDVPGFFGVKYGCELEEILTDISTMRTAD